jgi:galactitol-specific phosphotransferase system IIC component
VNKVKGTIDADTGVERVDARLLEAVIIETTITETIDVSIYNVVRQTSSGITTSLSNMVTGSKITITNTSGGTNILNITVQDVATPNIHDCESFSIVFNGTTWDVV